jgi:hypothetical protein
MVSEDRLASAFSAEEARQVTDQARGLTGFRDQVVMWILEEALYAIKNAAARGESSILYDGLPKLRTPVTESDHREVKRRLEVLGYRVGGGSGPERISWARPE